MHIKRLVALAFLLALGIILPYFTHSLGFMGVILLPMHIPVLLAGIIFGPASGWILGLLIPLLSLVLTGMPASIMLPIIMTEMSLYGLVGGYLFNYAKMKIYFSLISAMVAGRIGYAVMLFILANVLHISNYANIASVFVAVQFGFMGILIQLLIIPPLVKAVKSVLNEQKYQ